jgi:type I restriction enzyme S subunit
MAAEPAARFPRSDRRGWRTVSVGDLGEFVNGYAFKSADWAESGGAPIIRIQNLTDPSKPYNNYHGTIPQRYRVTHGDLLISWSASLDAFIWRGPDAWLNQHIFKVSPNEQLVDPGFLYFLMKREIRTIAQSARGSTMKHVTGKAFREHEVLLPPLDEQRRIARILLTIQGAVDAAWNVVRSHRSLKTAMILSLFAPFENTARPIAEVLREPLRNGHSARADSTGTVRTLTLSAVTYDAFTDANTKMTGATDDMARDLWLVPGDILVERANTRALVGTAALYRGPQNWAIFPDLMIRVRTDASVIRPDVLIEYLRLPRVRDYLGSRARGTASTMPKIDQGTLASLPIAVPPPGDQNRLAGVFQVLDDAVTANHLRASAFGGVFASAIAGLVGGES